MAAMVAMRPMPAAHDMLDRSEGRYLDLSFLKPEAILVCSMPRYIMDRDHEYLGALSGSQLHDLSCHGNGGNAGHVATLTSAYSEETK